MAAPRPLDPGALAHAIEAWGPAAWLRESLWAYPVVNAMHIVGIAALLGWPVVLVVDVSGQAQSAGAVALGCMTYDRRIRVAGVILNKVASERHRRLAAAGMERIGLPVRTIPGFYEILQGEVSISRFREIAMEDLLQRDPVRLDTQQLDQFLGGRCVLVTGAGGSIGSELAAQVARFAPRKLVLLERAEFALFEVERRIRQLWPQLEVSAVVADVVDERRQIAAGGMGRRST